MQNLNYTCVCGYTGVLQVVHRLGCRHDTSLFFVCCPVCGRKGKAGKTEKEAVQYWNERVNTWNNSMKTAL